MPAPLDSISCGSLYGGLGSKKAGLNGTLPGKSVVPVVFWGSAFLRMIISPGLCPFPVNFPTRLTAGLAFSGKLMVSLNFVPITNKKAALPFL
jgi:hypothetical protein